MPIIRSTAQKSKTLPEFYQDLTLETNDYFVQVGHSMLEFIAMVNDTFQKTTLFGLTSHNNLIIQNNDKWEESVSIKVSSSGKSYQFSYPMRDEISPWKYASVTGQANTLNEAKDYLIIALKESGGWDDNQELRKLYYKLKKFKTDEPEFTLWLEFEEVDPGNWDITNDFCNIQVTLEDGRRYAMNVWTYTFLQTSVKLDQESGESLSGNYQIPPDLLVKELSRDCIEKTIEDLLKQGNLEDVLNASALCKE